MEAQHILSAVQKGANERHGEVLIKVFAEHGIMCPNCNYPQNAKAFRVILRDYTRAQLSLHRARKHALYCPNTYKPTHAHSVVYRRENIVKSIQEDLRPYRPCQDCIEKYNPTCKLRKRSPRLPTREKGFLDHDFSGSQPTTSSGSEGSA